MRPYRLIFYFFKCYLDRVQYHEREVLSINTKNKLVQTLNEEIPDTGLITLYLLPDEVNDKQVTILGKNAPHYTIGRPRLIVF